MFPRNNIINSKGRQRSSGRYRARLTVFIVVLLAMHGVRVVG